MLLAKAALPGDAQAPQQRGRGRIDACVRTGYAVTAFRQHARQRGHGRAADSNEIDGFHAVHVPLVRATAVSRISSFPSPLATSRARTPSGTVSMGRGV